MAHRPGKVLSCQNTQLLINKTRWTEQLAKILETSQTFNFTVQKFLNLSRAHFAIKTGCAHIGLYTYMAQKLPVPGHGGHIR